MVTYMPQSSGTHAMRRMLGQSGHAPSSGNSEEHAWIVRARCAEIGADPETFYPGEYGSLTTAKAICDACPVESECLAWALKVESQGSYSFGVFGGTSARRRSEILGRRPVSWS